MCWYCVLVLVDIVCWCCLCANILGKILDFLHNIQAIFFALWRGKRATLWEKAPCRHHPGEEGPKKEKDMLNSLRLSMSKRTFYFSTFFFFRKSRGGEWRRKRRKGQGPTIIISIIILCWKPARFQGFGSKVVIIVCQTLRPSQGVLSENLCMRISLPPNPDEVCHS